MKSLAVAVIVASISSHSQEPPMLVSGMGSETEVKQRASRDAYHV